MKDSANTLVGFAQAWSCQAAAENIDLDIRLAFSLMYLFLALTFEKHLSIDKRSLT